MLVGERESSSERTKHCQHLKQMNEKRRQEIEKKRDESDKQTFHIWTRGIIRCEHDDEGRQRAQKNMILTKMPDEVQTCWLTYGVENVFASLKTRSFARRRRARERKLLRHTTKLCNCGILPSHRGLTHICRQVLFSNCSETCSNRPFVLAPVVVYFTKIIVINCVFDLGACAWQNKKFSFLE